MQNAETKRALVRGAPSGLGVQFATTLAARGYNLVLAARRRSRCSNLPRCSGSSGVEIVVEAIDLPDGAYSVLLFGREFGEAAPNARVARSDTSRVVGIRLVQSFIEIDEAPRLRAGHALAE